MNHSLSLTQIKLELKKPNLSSSQILKMITLVYPNVRLGLSWVGPTCLVTPLPKTMRKGKNKHSYLSWDHDEGRKQIFTNRKILALYFSAMKVGTLYVAC